MIRGCYHPAARAAEPPGAVEELLAQVRDVSATLSANGVGWTMWDYAGDFAVVLRENDVRVPDRELVRALGLNS